MLKENFRKSWRQPWNHHRGQWEYGRRACAVQTAAIQ